MSFWPSDRIAQEASGSDCRSRLSHIRCRSTLSRRDPWTNSNLPSASERRRQQQQQQQQQKQQQPTLKSAGKIYDSMLEAERRLAARHGTNNNTKDMPSGVSDIQQHTSGKQRTTVITRLSGEHATKAGILDVNFVFDTQSSNCDLQESGMTFGSLDVSFSSDSWRWMHPRASLTNQQLPDSDGLTEAEQMQSQGFSRRQQQQGLSDEQQHKSSGMKQQQQQQQEQQQGGKGEGEGEGVGESESDGDVQSYAEELFQHTHEKQNQPFQHTYENQTTARKKLNMVYLNKEGNVIGSMNVFADVVKREFMILLTDSVVEAFLVDPGQFRAIARRTGCEITVTRRILNRRIGPSRWLKYLVLTIKGPTCSAIAQCDKLMVKVFPPYKVRREYLEPAPVALFVKESYPDNTMLYFNFQRTGPTADRLGDMRLQTPFSLSAYRPLKNTPWKSADWRLFRGTFEPRNTAAEITMKHVYPEWGIEVGNYVENYHKWEHAGDYALELEKQKNLERSVRVQNRKLESQPLFAENA